MAAAPSHWQDIQTNTFTRWCNDELKKRGFTITDIKNDFKDGVLLVNLMEVISGKSLGRYNKHPRIINQKLENLNIALAFIKSEGIKLVNVGSDDINSGNIRIILGLIWTLILRYEIKHGGEQGDAISDLLKWVQSKIPEYNITNFTTDWNDGRAVCALVDAMRPGLIPNHRDMNPDDRLQNATTGIAMGDKQLGVDPLVYPDEMVHPKVDKLAMMTYIAQYRNLRDPADALRCHAYGPGLVEGVANETAPFTVKVPKDVQGKIEVKVVGPKSEAKVNLQHNANDNTYAVSYTPDEPGQYFVHVTLDSIHVPGSIFQVVVLEKESLGGEGKIRVFYSTTAATQKGKDDFTHLQNLFQIKKIHLRPDFEPWIPVDVMDKPDREAVFRKAGARVLPLVFVDDHYVGGYDTILELNENGALDKLLMMDKQRELISEEEHLARLKSVASDPHERKL